MSHIIRVVVGGLNPAGLFFMERLSQSTDFQVVGAFDSRSERRRFVEGTGLAFWERNPLPELADDVELVILCDRVSASEVAAILDAGKHVIIHQPWLLRSAELMELHELAKARSLLAAVTSVRRWSAEYLAVSAALKTGRIGSLRSARLSSLEMRIPDEVASASVLREFGYAWFDQLLTFCRPAPVQVYGKCQDVADSTTDQGFLSVIEFADGCTAQVEVITNSRLGHRTGWILEGRSGSYRNDRLFTETKDGEIVDEPAPKPEGLSADLFLSQLASACHGQETGLVGLAEAARTVKLIEALERSAELKQAVNLIG